MVLGREASVYPLPAKLSPMSVLGTVSCKSYGRLRSGSSLNDSSSLTSFTHLCQVEAKPEKNNGTSGISPRPGGSGCGSSVPSSPVFLSPHFLPMQVIQLFLLSVSWSYLIDLGGTKAKLFVTPACMLEVTGSALSSRELKEFKCHGLQLESQR